ncbi:Ff.00g131840.m01.CDS01 [Fusarium sp. VM40]|nr:Ff.00g131840.m01.CDS01 [Fusarium sp. VM40]
MEPPQLAPDACAACKTEQRPCDEIASISTCEQLPSYVSEQLGDEATQRAISSRYFQVTHNWLPIISKQRFFHRLDAPTETCPPDWKLLLLCMKLINWLPDASSPQTPLYRAAKRFFLEVQLSGVISLAVLQAAILIAFYEIGHGIFPFANISVGICANMSEEETLQLQRIIEDMVESTRVDCPARHLLGVFGCEAKAILFGSLIALHDEEDFLLPVPLEIPLLIGSELAAKPWEATLPENDINRDQWPPFAVHIIFQAAVSIVRSKRDEGYEAVQICLQPFKSALEIAEQRWLSADLKPAISGLFFCHNPFNPSHSNQKPYHIHDTFLYQHVLHSENLPPGHYLDTPAAGYPPLLASGAGSLFFEPETVSTEWLSS